MKKKAMIYLDANIFAYTVTGDSKQSESCLSIIKKVITGEIEACTSLLTWDEVLYALKREIGRAKALEEGRKFLEIPHLFFIEVDDGIITKAQSMAELYHLDPRDAIHAATAILNGCKEIISDDKDFDAVKELKRIAP